MKNLFILVFLIFSSFASATTYYVATNGNDNNPGTLTQPWGTWQKGFNSISAGDILYIRGGNYTGMYGPGHGVFISYKDGTSGSNITVLAYPGETPVLDCASLSASAGINFGILMRNCNYWYIKGLTLKNVREYNNLTKSAGGLPTASWELGNCNNITLDQCKVSNCGNGFSLNGTLKNINYINCDSYLNFDYYDNGGLANGFNGNITGSSTVYYNGCRSWSNSDDGYDNFGGAGYIVYNNCWAYRNGKDVPIIGNGDGFKIGCDLSGTELAGIQRTLNNCISADNDLMGFDESMDVVTSMDMVLNNCASYKNTRDYGFRFYQPLGTGATTLKNNISYANSINYQGRTRNIADHNTWNTGAPVVSDADFVSLDMTQLLRPRKADGSLPDIDFMRLKQGSALIDAGVNVGITYTGSAPDIGPFEAQSGVVAPTLTYVSSAVENVTPSVVGITYNLTLANITPAASCFTVSVNSVARTVNTLSISGNKVQLNLSSPVVNGDIVTLSYTKPATNPLQCVAASQAITISAKPVSNGVNTVIPALVSSVIENIAPNIVEMIYNVPLASTVPTTSAFTAKVNGINKSVNTVAVSGNKVDVILQNDVAHGDFVTITYTKPATNPIQATSGVPAETILSQPVINNIQGITTNSTDTNKKNISIYPNPAKEFINISNLEPSAEPQVIRIFDYSGKLCMETRLSASINSKVPINLKSGMYILQIALGPVIKFSQRLIVI